MTAAKKETRGRPKKGTAERGEHAGLAGAVWTEEVMRCYSTSFRITVACVEMESFLQGSGPANSRLSEACSNLPVFLPFIDSRLFGKDVHSELGKWMSAEEWGRVDCWKFLCDRWRFRWEKPCKTINQGNFTSVWRLGCMVEGWRLLDEHYISGPRGGSYPVPSVKEISEAAMEWLAKRGVTRSGMESILSKDEREFGKIALDWIPRMGLKCAPGLLFPDEQEVPPILTGLSEEAQAELARNILSYDAMNSGAVERELEELWRMDWP